MYGNIAKAGRKDNKTRYLEKQLSVLNASLHQAETIKTRIEQQMDNLDVTDTHYDKKISDLQRRLDAQYDRIDEVEETMTELKSQIYELKKNQIDADSIYGFLGAFNEVYSECTDAEKKQFMQAFIERIDIFPERRKDGNWIQNIKFQFPVPIIKEGKEVAKIKGNSLDKEKSDEHMVSLEKLSTLGTVVLLFQLKQKPDDYINVTIELDDMDITSAETKATYDEIKKYVAEHNAGMKVSNLYISQVKRKCGIEVGKNYNLPKNENSRQPQCPEDKESAIVEALKHCKMNK